MTEPMSDTERKLRAWATPKWCEVCGARSTCVARAGFSSCDEHKMLPKPDHALFDFATGRPLTQVDIPDNTLPETTAS